jgi:signal transduction histidine kinase
MNPVRYVRMLQHSVAGKLIRMNVLVAAVALTFACASFLFYDAYSFRQNLINSLATESEIIGSNSVSALAFDDAQSARATLEALRNSPAIVAALIVSSSGAPFASYRRDSDSPAIAPTPLPPTSSGANWVRGDQILVASRISLAGKSIGTVYLQAETREIGHRFRRYVLIAMAILVICLLLAVLLTSSARQSITGPLSDLASVAQSVSRDQDFSLRAPPSSERDEVGVLVRSFNQMLEQIQQRDQALVESRDALERRVLERTAELQSANSELEAFSYSVAHDLRGPLDSVGNTVFLINQSSREKLDSQAQEMLSVLPVVTARMARLIDDLLNLSRSKSVALHLEPVDLSGLANDIAEDLRAADAGRNVEVSIVPGLLAIADKGFMRIVLTNLLANAWKYSAKAAVARIEFGSRRQEGETVFYVCDNGAGFDPDLKHRLFQPFQRLHAQSEFAGTGIGLATVQRIVGRHGGRIWAEAELGKGATFFFTLQSFAQRTRTSGLRTV